IEDMAVPSHTTDDIHAFIKPFETYVNGNWDQIVTSDAFRQAVNVDAYLNGNYKPGDVFNPGQIMDELARVSSKYPNEEALYDTGIDPTTGEPIPILNKDKLLRNVDALIPLAIKYTAGYIDSIYENMNKSSNSGSLSKKRKVMLASLESDILTLAQLIGSGTGAGVCTPPPPEPSSPANDHPDERFDVSDEFYWEQELHVSDYDLTNLYMRTAIKKGYIGVWYKKRFMDILMDARTKYANAPQNIKDAVEAEFQSVGKKLESQSGANYWEGAPDIALFANGYYKPSISLMLKFGEPVSFEKTDFDPQIVKDRPVLLIPSGGLYGLKGSSFLKNSLDEYVKNGGTLVAFAQQHGADWDLLPVPVDPVSGQREAVSGYGYQEDQNCQFNSVYIDTYHPMLAGLGQTASIGVDGYFTSYPKNGTVLLRRTANGQPAMLMYPYGKGYVIATTLYTDFASAHSQANQAEINFVQNIISWAKKPVDIPEIRPGQTVNLNIELKNLVDADAASVKFMVLGPRRNIISEQTVSNAVSAGQTATIPFSYASASGSELGVYHVDYALLDASGNIIQPQAETDSGGA
ncbi:MAG: hypothetical protein M0022_00860, partial [Desulfobacteraceae bacterium]|nr:hypothetical protein [Desulfobacteraceae bacterium]